MADPNYITPVGLDRIRRELNWLQKSERPRITREVTFAASLGDRSENAEYIYGKKRLREIDSRMRHLIGRLSNVQEVDPARMKGTRVNFGATVTVADEEGEEHTYTLYGEDEVDVDRGILSWKSPIGSALVGRSEGDTVKFVTPGGKRQVEIISVKYVPQEPLPEDLYKL